MKFRRSASSPDSLAFVDVLGGLSVLGTFGGWIGVIMAYAHIGVTAGLVSLALWLGTVFGWFIYITAVPSRH